MKITAELDIGAITVSEDEMLLIVMPTTACPPYVDEDPDVDPLMESFKEAGLGDRVFILWADDVQIAKVKK